jgi:uracil-DNA glycosylase
MCNLQGIVALGKMAFDVAADLLVKDDSENKNLIFRHGYEYNLENPANKWLISSYHPSRQNTQTGRLTEPMFNEIWQKALKKLK